MLKLTRKFALVILAIAAAGAVAAARARADITLAVNAVDAQVAVSGNTAQATFKIQVANQDATDVNAMFVVFSDGSSAAIGDVAAGATVTSDAVSRIIDLGDTHSRSIPVPVTLTYTAAGQSVQRQWSIALTASN